MRSAYFPQAIYPVSFTRGFSASASHGGNSVVRSLPLIISHSQQHKSPTFPSRPYSPRPPITSPSSSSTVNNLLTFALSGVEGAKYFHEKINENHYPDAKALPHNPSLNAVAALIANNEVSGVHDLVQEVVRVFDTAIDFFKER